MVINEHDNGEKVNIEHDNGDSKYRDAENLDIMKGKREKTRDVKKPLKPDQYQHSYYSLPLSLPLPLSLQRDLIISWA